VQPPERDAVARPVALHDTARSVLYLLEPECARRGVDVRWQLGADAPTVRADPVALEQIVHNLVMNALQALEQVPAAERRLELALGTEAGRGVLRVRDHGPGIDDERLARIFEPFFTTRPGGLGLGLSLCETLALGMGGALTARRIEPRGAEFRLELPLASAGEGAR
jgi:C4-dicarboxylate-specific signal transduction histidine kinase